MEGNLVEEGPWRATRLWNSIVRSLHEGDLPRKKHRKHLRIYEDCFTANEVIEWLFRQLKKNPNFDSDVSKEQTLMLLQKLFRAGVIVRLDDDLSSSISKSNSMLTKTPSAMLTGSNDRFKPGNDLYRLAPKATSVLHTPGKKSREESKIGLGIRSPLEDLGNTPKSDVQHNIRRNGILQRSFRKIRNKHRDLIRQDSNSDDEDEENYDVATPAALEKDIKERQNLNLSYLQSLPANSLVVLDNDSMWREVYLDSLKNLLTTAHINSLNINVSNIIFNMTHISEKGVVKLPNKSANDLPKWTLSAMKCLANWPKPFQASNDPDGAMPSYEGFEIDVFNVVKEYFTSLPTPLTTFELFDMFVSTFIKAEAVSSAATQVRHQDNLSRYRSNFSITPMPYLETDLDSSRPSTTSSPLSGYYSGTSSCNLTRMRTANIKPTMHVMQPSCNSTNYENLNSQMSPTAIMRNFLPPNT